MKISRFAFAAVMSAMVLASCQKEQEVAPENKNLKSVEVNLNNVSLGTKAIGGLPEKLDGKNIQLNSLQFFFSDGTTLYEAKMLKVTGLMHILMQLSSLISVEAFQQSSTSFLQLSRK